MSSFYHTLMRAEALRYCKELHDLLYANNILSFIAKDVQIKLLHDLCYGQVALFCESLKLIDQALLQKDAENHEARKRVSDEDYFQANIKVLRSRKKDRITDDRLEYNETST